MERLKTLTVELLRALAARRARKDWDYSSGPMRLEKKSLHNHNRKRVKVKKAVGGRDVKAEVIKDRTDSQRRESGHARPRGVRKYLGQKPTLPTLGVTLEFPSLPVYLPQARVAPTRYDSLYFAFIPFWGRITIAGDHSYRHTADTEPGIIKTWRDEQIGHL